MFKVKIKDTIDTLFKIDLILLKNHINSGYVRRYINEELLIVSFKQLLVVLRSLSKRTESFKVYFVIKDKAQKSFFEKIVNKLNNQNILEITDNLREINTKNKPSIIMLFDIEIFKDAETLINHSLPTKNCLVFSVNPSGFGINEGIYSITVQPDNLNKMLFFILLVSKAIKQ